jgi:hypothetical protein
MWSAQHKRCISSVRKEITPEVWAIARRMQENTAPTIDEHRNSEMQQIGSATGEKELELTCYQALQRDT